MAELPSGTVTLLFSDIQGSTRLLQTLGRDRYNEVLADHRRLLRDAFAAHAGVEVGTEGDSFFVAFRRASDGTAAAAAAQRALAAHQWPAGEELRVRIGIHTGEPKLDGEGYVGLDVHRAARIAAAAHGGQVLLSQTTRELLGGELPGGVALRDLGEHRLKDLTQPQRLYQLLIEGLPAAFPPLKTLENRPTNLPVQPTPLVGRERELADVVELLGRREARLLTLTGPGGTGKTRLALQAAADLVDRFPDGAFFVSLAPLGDAELVLPTIAQTLGLKETGGQPLGETLKEHLRGKELLLVLDNFEHLSGGGLIVAELLAAAPESELLVTSQSPLHVSGEREYRVPPLGLPDLRRLPGPESLLRYDAVALFIERAQAVRSDFQATSQNAAAIAEICVRLDGLPLAIELAAARIRILPPEALLGRLEQRLRLLTGGARDLPSRQQTLRGAIEWSYRLLRQEEQRLFARLAVFVGGCTFEAAEAVCDPEEELDIDIFDGVFSLVEKALLHQDEGPEGDPRFSMLETIREYALERLAAFGEAEELSRRHAGYFLELAGRAAKELRGAGESHWLERLEAEHNNLRAALAWSGATGATGLQLQMAGALWIFWLGHGHLSEGRAWLEQALQSADTQPPGARANALLGLASLTMPQGDFDAMKPLAEESLALCEELDDARGMGRSMTLLGIAALHEGDLDRARPLYEESVTLARRSDSKWSLAVALNNLGNLCSYEDDPARGVEAWEEALALGRELGSADVTGRVLTNLGFAKLAQGKAHEAAKLFGEGLELFSNLGTTVGTSYGLEGLAAAAASSGEAERAARLLAAAESLRAEIGVRLEPFEQRLHEQTVASVQRGLDEGRLRAARAEGHAMPLERAVAYALEGAATGEKPRAPSS